MYLINLIDKGQIDYLEELYSGYVECFEDLYQSMKVVTICPYKEDYNIDVDQKVISRLETKGIYLLAYNNLEEVANFVKELKGKKYINTFREQEILNKNILKKMLGQKTTENPEIFLDKFLQRSLIGKHFPDTVAKYVLLEENENILNKNLSNFQFPLIIKPVGGTASFGVQKVHDMKELIECIKDINESMGKLSDYGLNKKNIIIEEFIEGQLYAITYFVDEDQKIHLTKPILQGDTSISKNPMLMYGKISDEMKNDIDTIQLQKFVTNTVKGGDIRNTFVCHQFKKTPEGKLKTIELNGRIGGFNIEMYKLSYGINFFKFIFSNGEYKFSNDILHNSATFWIYADEEILFNGYKETIIETIKKLESLKWKIFNEIKGTKIGPPQLGYYYYGITLLKNDNLEIFNRDFNYVKENYFNLLEK